MELLPAKIYQMCVHGALIVGSQAKRLVGEDVKTNDWDLLVPYSSWPIVSLLVPSTAKLNKFGGLRFYIGAGSKSIEVDVWPDNIQNYFEKCKTKHGGTIYAIDYVKSKVYSVRPLVEN